MNAEKQYREAVESMDRQTFGIFTFYCEHGFEQFLNDEICICIGISEAELGQLDVQVMANEGEEHGEMLDAFSVPVSNYTREAILQAVESTLKEWAENLATKAREDELFDKYKR